MVQIVRNLALFLMLVLLACQGDSDPEESMPPAQQDRPDIPVAVALQDTSYLNHSLRQERRLRRQKSYLAALDYLQAGLDSLQGQKEHDAQLPEIAADYLGQYNKIGNIDALMRVQQICKPFLGEIHPALAYNYRALALRYRAAKNPSEALIWGRKAFDLWHQLSLLPMPDVGISTDKTLLEKARMQNIIGVFHRDAGHVDSALAFHKSAIKLYKKSAVHTKFNLGAAYYNIAIDYRLVGQYSKSVDYALQAEELFTTFLKAYNEADSGKYIRQLGNLRNTISLSYLALEKYREAKQYQKMALAIKERYPKKAIASRARSYNNLGLLYAQLGELDSAATVFNEALALKRQLRNPDSASIAITHQNIAEVARQRGNYQQGLLECRKALALQTAAYPKGHPEISETYLKMALLSLLSNQIADAQGYIEKSRAVNKVNFGDLEYSGKVLSVVSEVYALDLQADIYAAMAMEDPANSSYFYKLELETREGSMDLMEGLAIEQLDDDSTLLWRARSAESYPKYIFRALDQYNLTGQAIWLEKAFLMAERSKAAILHRSLQAANARNSGNIPDDQLGRYNGYNREAQQTKNLLTLAEAGIRDADIDSLRLRRIELSQKLRQINEQFTINFTAYQEEMDDIEHLEISDYQKHLNENQLIVEYVVGDSSVLIFTLDRNTLAVTQQPIDPSLAANIVRLRKTISNEGSLKKFCQYAYPLYQTLLAPIADKIINKELIIIPDQYLVRLPFEALLYEKPDEKTTTDYSMLPYVITKNAICYFYSARLWHNNVIRETTQWPMAFLGLAPVCDKGISNNPLLRGQLLAAQKVLKLDTSDTTRFTNLRLPNTRDEIEEIREIIRQDLSFIERLADWIFGNHTRAIIGNGASEDRFIQEALADFRFIHFATHGYLSSENPELSGLWFQQGEDSTQPGILQLGEIYGLKLTADLVVLSACETGLGHIAPGEGVIGLTRGFLAAGARNLLVSLWQVEDRSTKNLMTNFYEIYLGNGNPSKTRALQAAKNDFIKGSRYANPFYWSAFVLIGE